MPNPRREESLVQETRRLSGCWVTAILRTFSLLGRTKSLTCELWRSGHRPHPRLRGPLGQTAANTTSCPTACKRCYRCPRRWRTLGQELTWSFRGAAPLRREKRENKVPVNFGLCLSIVDVSEGTLQKPKRLPKDSPFAGSGFPHVPLISDTSGFTATDAAARILD